MPRDAEAPDLSRLFTPFQLGRLTLPNRFVLPGMQRQWCVDGAPEPKLGEYYRRCVEGGVGLVITESCAVDHPSSTQVPFFTRITPRTFDAWARCVDEVKSAGGKMLMQLWHEGAIRAEGGDGPYAQHPTLSPSGLAHGKKPNGRAATELEGLLMTCMVERLFKPEAERNPAVAADAEERLQRPLKVLDGHLAAHAWLVADHFTIADLNVASALAPVEMAGVDLSAYASVTKWLAACTSRPGAAG